MDTLKLVVLVPVVAGSVCCAALRAQDRYPVRRLTSHPAQEGFPSWSPDGRTLVYSFGMRNDSARMTGLWKVSPEGGEARQFTRFIGEHPDWSPDGHYIVFDADEGNAVHLVAATGGQPVRIVPASIRIFGGGLPSWSPDGGRIAFKEASNLHVLDVRTGESRVVLSAPDSVLVLPGCWSRDGREIYVTARHRVTYLGAIWRVPAEGGEPRRLTPEPDRAYRYMDLSPDGSHLAFVACEGRNCNLWVMPAAGGRPIQLTRDPAYNDTPRWSPDGTRIAFTSTRAGGFDVWVMDVDIGDLRAAVAAANR